MPQLGWSKHMRDLDTPSNVNAIGNYSVTEKIFQLAPPIDEMWVMTRMIVGIQGASPFWAQGYGPINAGLTNGISVEVGTNGGATETDFTDGVPIVSNTEWGFSCFDVEDHLYGAGDDHLTVRWTFAKNGVPIFLRGVANDVFRVRLNDDFSTLVKHRFKCHGYTKTEGFT